MKYIMFRTMEGQKLPLIFPDCLTHAIVAIMGCATIKSCMNTEALAVSAGFVGLGLGAEVYGNSESLGGLESVPADAARIMVGDSIAFMPDDLATMMLERLRQADKPSH